MCAYLYVIFCICTDIVTIPAEFERLTDENYNTKRLRTAEKQKLLDIAGVTYLCLYMYLYIDI
jgi:hypothetical protein